MTQAVSNRKKKKANLTKWNLFLDIALVLAFIVEMEESFTGLPFHEVLGLVFAAMFVLHIILHWDWVVSITRTFFKKLIHESRVNYVLNVALFIDMIVITVTGIVISHTLGFRLDVARDWQKIHIMASELSLIIVGLHVAMHWKWLSTNTTQYIFKFLKIKRPVRQTNTGQVNQPKEIFNVPAQ